METIAFLFVATVVLWLNGRATFLILYDELSEPQQRKLQLMLVWLLPLLGAIVVLAVHRPKEKPSGKYPEEALPPDDFFGRKTGSQKTNEMSDDD